MTLLVLDYSHARISRSFFFLTNYCFHAFLPTSYYSVPVLQGPEVFHFEHAVPLTYLLLFGFWQIVPAASVFGVSWKDWQRIFAHTKLVSNLLAFC
jgi:hypothetical protein